MPINPPSESMLLSTSSSLNLSSLSLRHQILTNPQMFLYCSVNVNTSLCSNVYLFIVYYFVTNHKDCLLTGWITECFTHVNDLFVITDMEFSSAPVTVQPNGPIHPPVLTPTQSPSSGPGPDHYGSGFVLQDDPGTSNTLNSIPGGQEGKARRKAACMLHRSWSASS